jgi:hypothetical protein
MVNTQNSVNSLLYDSLWNFEKSQILRYFYLKIIPEDNILHLIINERKQTISEICHL